MHYLSGQNREQTQFFTKLEDLVSAKHYVRLIDLIAEKFFSENVSSFDKKGSQNVGRKAYSPSCLLKLYIYGYLNGISSSRKLERECARNLELMWLMNQLVPDHKTIADFRRDNSEAIKQSVLAFGQWLQQGEYIKGDVISIDGSKLRANASRRFDIEHVTRKLEQLECQLQEYIDRISSNDQNDDDIGKAQEEKDKLNQDILQLQQEIQELELKRNLLYQQTAKTLSPTDLQARVMRSRQGTHFCYNVQVVVDEQHRLILCNNILNHVNDKGQLKPMVEQAEKVLNKNPKEVLADAGYYQLDHLEELESKNINCYVAINDNQEKTKELEHGIKFEFYPEENVYRCSQGQKLTPRNGLKKDTRRGTLAQAYRGINCEPCLIRNLCTKSDARIVYRYTNNEWRERYRNKIESKTGRSKMKMRSSISEHVFGTLKSWMGHTPLLLRGKIKVQTELNIYAIAYNFKRMLNVASFEDLEKLYRPIPIKVSI